MNLKLYLISLVILVSPLVQAGKELNNGGNARGLEFKSIAKQAVDELANSGLPGATPEKIARLQEALDSAIILSVNKPLFVSVNGVDQDCAVVNVPHIKTILISDKWNLIKDFRIKLSLAIHELEGLLGEEYTGRYNLSAEYLTFMGYRGDSASALTEANGAAVKGAISNTANQRYEEYVCYESDSTEKGIAISIDHNSLVVYTVGLISQNGGMYSNGDGRQSIVIYQEERAGIDGNFSLENGEVVTDNKPGGYTDALGFISLQFIVSSGRVKSFIGIRQDGTRFAYENCKLRFER